MKLTATDLVFSYHPEQRRILDSVSFELHTGEVVGLSAPSGFGKTTLCRLLAGYLPPQQGQVLLDGQPVTKISGPCPVQLIWQHPEQVINPRLRLRETLWEAGPLPQDIPEALGIEPAWLDRFPAELSGGELQRFCVARALGSHTRFVLADEITTMLDLVTQAQLWQFLLREAKQRALGLLVVSHHEALLDSLCTRKMEWEVNK